MNDNLEDSAKYLMDKLSEMVKLCKDENLSSEEKSYLIEVLTKKMRKKLKEKFLNMTESSDE